MDEARRLAVEDGIATAELLAEASGIELGNITEITDSNTAPGMPQPVPFASTGE